MIGNAVRVMEIATGQREEEYEATEPKDAAAAELGREGREGEGRKAGTKASGGNCKTGCPEVLGKIEGCSMAFDEPEFDTRIGL